jgi:hypothetical protein
MAVLRHDPSERAREDVPPLVIEPPLCVLSAADDTWRCTLEQPAPSWQALAFDDSGWDALVDRPIPEVDWGKPNGYQWHTCHDEMAAGLGFPQIPEGVPPRGRVWVRKVFEIPQPPTS